MALQTTGPISIDDLRNEFAGGTNSILSNYYRGVNFVPDTSTNSGIPTSGEIKLSDFYGGSNLVDVSYTQHRPFYSLSEFNACNITNISVVYQISSIFNFTQTIYSDSSGINTAPSGWYSNGTGVRQWSGVAWLGGGANLCSSGDPDGPVIAT